MLPDILAFENALNKAGSPYTVKRTVYGCVLIVPMTPVEASEGIEDACKATKFCGHLHIHFESDGEFSNFSIVPPESERA